ncbi:hypothetical protein JHK85_003837 [Glycine max]|nr:hypothetical protein JHK85_003837 [Glycine max]
MAAKRLIVVVESTAAMGPYWETILRDYLDKIIRCFGENDSTVQNSCSNVEFALVSYNTHGCYSGCLVQRTGWTRDPDVFFMWLSSIPFSGGGFNDAVIAEGLAEALVCQVEGITKTVPHRVPSGPFWWSHLFQRPASSFQTALSPSLTSFPAAASRCHFTAIFIRILLDLSARHPSFHILVGLYARHTYSDDLFLQLWHIFRRLPLPPPTGNISDRQTYHHQHHPPIYMTLMARFHLWHDTSLAHLPLKFGAILTPSFLTCFALLQRIFQSPMLRPPLFSVFSKATAFILPLIFWQRTFWLPILSLSPFAHGYLPCGTLNTSLYLGMFPNSQSGDPNQQNVDMHQHCILVAASNPYPLQTPIYVPQLQNLEQSETIDSFPGNRLYDAEAVAKAFPQFSISLSVICPKELPKIKGIYNAGNRNSKAADPPVLAKTPHFLILISEGFREAQGALKVGEGYSNSSESEK